MAKKRYNAFTIVELLVAMALLVILLGLSGMVFHTTVAAHRAAGATIDVTRNLQAITEQLNADFRGLRKDAPVFIAFNAFDTNGDGFLDSYFDTIHFFADGDFQTMRQYPVTYDSSGDDVLNAPDSTRQETIYGDVARIYYGNANTPAGLNYGVSGLLSRKSHILTSHLGLLYNYGEIPLVSNWPPPAPIVLPPATPLVYNYNRFDTSFGAYTDENELEFNTITLTDWVNALNYLDPLATPTPNNADWFITNCMTDTARPIIDFADVNTLHLLLSQGVAQMRIQWAYTEDELATPGLFTGVRWWPSVDPAGDGTVVSDFVNMNGGNPFGVYLTLPNGANNLNWLAIQNCWTGGVRFKNTFYPKALKFTFVLKDSNGIFADGKIFTHIVYLDN